MMSSAGFIPLSVAPGTSFALLRFALGLREMHRSGQESAFAGRRNAVCLGLVVACLRGKVSSALTGDLVWPATVGGVAGIGT